MVQDYPDWTKAIGFLGRDEAGDLVLIRVETTGQIQVLMKGLYGEALRTVALDDQGYLAAYVLDDESQWGTVIKVGNAELASRLGSPAYWDWRGQVVFSHDFANGLGPIAALSNGVGASTSLDPTRFFSGGYALKLVGGSTATWMASAGVDLSIPPSDRLGAQIRWAQSAAMDELRLRVHRVKDEVYWQGFLKYVWATQKLQYLDSEDNYQDIAVVDYGVGVRLFTNLKLVIDIDTGKYVRALMENHEYPLTASLRQIPAVGSADSFSFDCYLKSRNGSNDYIYLDAMIATVSEPE